MSGAVLLSNRCAANYRIGIALIGAHRFTFAGESAYIVELVDKDARGIVFARSQQASRNSADMNATVAPPRTLHCEIRQGCNGLQETFHGPCFGSRPAQQARLHDVESVES